MTAFHGGGPATFFIGATCGSSTSDAKVNKSEKKPVKQGKKTKTVGNKPTPPPVRPAVG